MLRALTHRRSQVLLLLLLLGGAVALRLQDPPVIERLRQVTFDYYNRMMPRAAGGDVLIVDIDEESIRAAGQWPWPRTLLARMTQALAGMGARSVTFDIVFSEPDRTSPPRIAGNLPAEMADVAAALGALPDNDDVFAGAIAQAGNVVMGFAGANQPTPMTPMQKAEFFNVGVEADPAPFAAAYAHFAASLPVLTAAAAGNGSFIMTPESDGVVRRVPMLVGLRGEDGATRQVYPALALEALRVALGKNHYEVESYGVPTAKGYGIRGLKVGDYTLPTDENGNFWVHYAGHDPARYVSAWRVLSGDIAQDAVKGKIVLVGTSAIGLLDLRSSPLDPVLPGVEVHAEIIEQILEGRFLRRPGFLEGAELWATAGVSLFIIAVAPFVGTGLLALLVGAVIAAGGLYSLYAYQALGYLIAPVYPVLTVTVIFIASSILANLRTEMEKRAVRHAFSHYISPALMDELASDPAKLRLGGEVREMTVMFTDIRNFTAISESMDPAELIRMMNDFLTPMTSAVLDNRGTVDKYMGDAMMAFWNAPLDDPDHARHACRAALDMQAALAPANAVLEARAAGQGRPFHALKAGIGIHTGRCSVGNMGSRQRFAYSALGDTVNLASRLEGQTKPYGIPVMMSHATYAQAPEFAALEIDLLAVKGRTEPERVYALLGGEEEARSGTFRDFAALHGRMLAAYRAREWDAAAALARDCAAARPDFAGLYALYEDRISGWRKTPPPAGWAGAWVAREK